MLLYYQFIWLKQRGDRDESDVLTDKYGGQYVLMFAPNTKDKTKRVYLPTKDFLSIEDEI